MASLKQTNAVEKDEDNKNTYVVVLEDTIFFPEGGGQPFDIGLIDKNPVFNVQRKGAEAHHFILDSSTSPPFFVGQIVRCTIDWKRRHDHMQQHSGQHLISALFEREYNIETKSWSLGVDTCYIEINLKMNITADQIIHVENRCNELIADSIPVTVNILKNKNEADVPFEVF